MVNSRNEAYLPKRPLWEQSSTRELDWRVNTCGRLTCDTKCWQARIKNGSCEQRVWKTPLPLNISFQSPITIGKTPHTSLKRLKKKKSLQSFWQEVKITFTNNPLTVKWQKNINHWGLFVYSLDCSISIIPWIVNLLWYKKRMQCNNNFWICSYPKDTF